MLKRIVEWWRKSGEPEPYLCFMCRAVEVDTHNTLCDKCMELELIRSEHKREAFALERKREKNLDLLAEKVPEILEALKRIA